MSCVNGAAAKEVLGCTATSAVEVAAGASALGSVIASHGDWKWLPASPAPGLILALLFLVRDHVIVTTAPALSGERQSLGEAVAHIAWVPGRSRTRPREPFADHLLPTARPS